MPLFLCHHGVQSKTLARWAHQQQIHSILLPGGTKRRYRLYDVSRIVHHDQNRTTTIEQTTEDSAIANDVIYARTQRTHYCHVLCHCVHAQTKR